MKAKRIPRSSLILDFDLTTKFSIRAYQKGLIDVMNRPSKGISSMIMAYMSGKLKGLVDPVKSYKCGNTDRTSHIYKDLKNEFGIMACEDGLIKHPQYVARLVENMMRGYLEGKFDKVLHHG